MTIALVIGLVLIVLVGAFMFLRGGTPGELSSADLEQLQKRSAPGVASVLKCREAILEIASGEDAPLRRLIDAGIAKVSDKVSDLDELRARVSRSERRVSILKTSTNQTAQVAGQEGLASSDVSAHQLEAELEKDKAIETALTAELKAIGEAADVVTAAAKNVPAGGKPSAEHVQALQEAADTLAEKFGLA